jgi:hypothetical protein
MTNDEQKTFVEAYAKNVASLPAADVADFVARYAAGEDIDDYSGDYIGVMDALCMWHSAIKWHLGQKL